MNSRKEEILQTLALRNTGMTAQDVAELLNIDRANTSRYLNELAKEKLVKKNSGRPVVYELLDEHEITQNEGKTTPEQVHVDTSSEVTFDALVGENGSLGVAIQQAKAAILYPPRGLHTVIFGETGTGKSLFAECMYHFAVEAQTIKKDAPFVSFNCADYAQNPQLLFGHIFGIKKGAYTGAEADAPGLLAKADQGILFLDEIHRLPPEGQEMLFTFIDKGIYRPLGESTKTHHASVQIIGATTEPQETFLSTFNRRIPMSINLPNIATRSLDERYEIITLFIKQEANRLHQRIEAEKAAIIAFMLYDAEGNIGQIKRDLKLVCAKAFLHYRTHNQPSLQIRKEDCSLAVQKGLLKMKELGERLDYFLEGKGDYLTFDPGAAEVVWSQDPERNMSVYNRIEEKVSTLSEHGINVVDLEQLILGDVDAYFETYVEELTQSNVHRELLPGPIWDLTSRLYKIAEERLGRSYNEKSRFAFALHLQSTIERLEEGHTIVHPDLNNIRKNFKKEFQVALDLSTIIEEECQLEIPFDEIGFISMFLSLQMKDEQQIKERVEVIVLMHGEATASSMLKTAQELLDTKNGIAMNMRLDMEVQTMYSQLLRYVKGKQGELNAGILLLTDMGSLNSFADLIFEETGIRTKAVSMTSTMVVLEALRMSDAGRSLEDIYQNTLLAFKNIVREENRVHQKTRKQKAVVVTCFTGEGVAAKLYQRIKPMVDPAEIKIIQMQFVEKGAFLQHIDALLEEYDIKAIAGTVEVNYQNIPFFSAYEIFDNDRQQVFQRLVNEEIPLQQIIHSLKQELRHVNPIDRMIYNLHRVLQQSQSQMQVVLDPTVTTGLIMHLAFLVENLKAGTLTRSFKDDKEFVRTHRLEMDILRTQLMPIEKDQQVSIPEDELAYVVQMILQNQLNNFVLPEDKLKIN